MDDWNGPLGPRVPLVVSLSRDAFSDPLRDFVTSALVPRIWPAIIADLASR